jgi:hypothetical protein
MKAAQAPEERQYWQLNTILFFTVAATQLTFLIVSLRATILPSLRLSFNHYKKTR